MYFDGCKTLDQLKALYKKLAIKHHPDLGGNTRVMQDINEEYQKTFEVLKRQHNVRQPNRKTTETPEQFRTVVEKLIKIKGIEIEVCGSWIWVSGETFLHKDELKAAGLLWSKPKKKWYWRPSDGKKRVHYRGNQPMSQIRKKYGSQVIKSASEETAA